MNQYRVLFLIFTLCTLALAVPRVVAQSYNTQEISKLIAEADTVIYRYHALPPSPYRVLIADNLALDWKDELYPRRNLFAVKSNLLFDAATFINVELEVPIGERYSIAGEWIFPWWLSDSRQNCTQLLNLNIEGRYWFGNRSLYEQLTGWAAGLYVGGGYYDLERKGSGYQGEHILSGGIAASYTHSIGGSAKLEYSLGVGFITTKYREYEAEKCGNSWLLVRERYGHLTWFGPTRARVSLSFMLNRKDKRGGAL